jgi:hypothetical protein
LWRGVVSRPFHRDAEVAAAGSLDTGRSEPFLRNIFETFNGRHNLSAFERNRVYLATAPGQFLCVTHPSGAGSTADCRSVAVGDYNNDGRADLFVRGPGGQPLALYENRCRFAGGYLKVTLRGTESNRQGLGAKLRLHAGGRTLTRWCEAANTFASQSAAEVVFGLGPIERIDWLSVDWPSGRQQRFESLNGNQWLEIVEGQREYERILPGELSPPAGAE